MNELRIFNSEATSSSVNFEIIKKITFTPLKSVKECSVCHSTEDSCLLSMGVDYGIIICDHCLSSFLQSLEVHKSNMASIDVCTAKLGTKYYILSKAELNFLINKIKAYFDILKKEHKNSLSSLEQLLVEQKRPLNKHSKIQNTHKKPKTQEPFAELYKQIRNLKDQVEKLKKQVSALNAKKTSLEEKNETYKSIISNLENKISKSQKDVSLTSDILNCQKRNGGMQNIGISRKKALEHPAYILRVRFVKNDLPCYTSKHYGNKQASVILDTNRDNDKLCLSLCKNCIETLILAFQSTGENNPVYQDYQHNLEIKYRSTFIGEHCHSCGCNNTGCYLIRIGSVEFKICEYCKEQWLLQLKQISQILKHKN